MKYLISLIEFGIFCGGGGGGDDDDDDDDVYLLLTCPSTEYSSQWIICLLQYFYTLYMVGIQACFTYYLPYEFVI
jgi:hypothetical protein